MLQPTAVLRIVGEDEYANRQSGNPLRMGLGPHTLLARVAGVCDPGRQRPHKGSIPPQ
jgi:hypothetical protein